jgi:FkbM family methyltransferase
LGEFQDMAFVLHMLRPEDLFCDVGANAGVYTVLASGAVRCQTVAIEPVPSTFEVLKSNITINEASDRVDALNYGVGSSRGTLHFTSSLWSFNHVVPDKGDDTIEVPVDTLDNLLQGRIPRVIKIDVEGFEGEVLKGARQTLADPGLAVVLMEVSSQVARYGQTKEGLKAQLIDMGFDPFWYSPFERRLVQPGTPQERQYNLIFVRDPAFVTERLTTAPKYRVHGREL